MTSPHLLHLLRHVSQIRGQEPGPDTPDLHPILLQLVVPVHHHHVECRLAAAVCNRLEIHLLGPPGRLRRRREVRLACQRDLGESGHEDQPWIGRLEQKRHERPGHDLSARNVHVVGLVEAVTQRDLADEEFEVEGGRGGMLGHVECRGI